MSLRIFVKESESHDWNELHLFDYKRNIMKVYNQNRSYGFTFAFFEKPITEWGYSSIDEAIEKLSKRGILGKEVEYIEVQLESEIEGWAKLAAYHAERNENTESSTCVTANVHKVLQEQYGLGNADTNWEIDYQLANHQ